LDHFIGLGLVDEIRTFTLKTPFDGVNA